MTPRTYKLGKRAELKEHTRSRIVEATFELHGEKGVVATSMQDVADRADVALHTVYRYFPRIDDLVFGCAERVKTHLNPPAAEVFAGIAGVEERARVLVREMFSMHQRGADLIQMARCQQAEVSALALALEFWTQHHETMVAEALKPAKTSVAIRRDILALTDFYVWKAFTDRGISTKRATTIITESVLTRLNSPRKAKGGNP